MPDINITGNGVYKLLKNLNVNKAAGPDQIPTKILQAAASELAPALSRLFQFSLDNGEVPQDWRGANIVPLYKKRGYPPGCKLLSLTAITYKLLEHIVHYKPGVDPGGHPP